MRKKSYVGRIRLSNNANKIYSRENHNRTFEKREKERNGIGKERDGEIIIIRGGLII